MTNLLLDHEANSNATSKNGLTPLHLCAQEDKVNCAAILVQYKANIDPQTKAGYTPLHVACHFGQINMVKCLLEQLSNVNLLFEVFLNVKIIVLVSIEDNPHPSPPLHVI